jgi:hypothetical protein
MTLTVAQRQKACTNSKRHGMILGRVLSAATVATLKLSIIHPLPFVNKNKTMPESNTGTKTSKNFQKVYLNIGETLWVRNFENDQARVANIPLSTDRLRFGDLVALFPGNGGMMKVLEVIKPSGHLPAIVLRSENGPLPATLFPQLDKLTPWERLDQHRVVIACPGSRWKKVERVFKSFALRASIFNPRNEFSHNEN